MGHLGTKGKSSRRSSCDKSSVRLGKYRWCRGPARSARPHCTGHGLRQPVQAALAEVEAALVEVALQPSPVLPFLPSGCSVVSGAAPRPRSALWLWRLEQPPPPRPGPGHGPARGVGVVGQLPHQGGRGPPLAGQPDGRRSVVESWTELAAWAARPSACPPRRAGRRTPHPGAGPPRLASHCRSCSNLNPACWPRPWWRRPGLRLPRPGCRGWTGSSSQVI